MKKILVFSSYGGGGHISATDTIKEYLNPHSYKIDTVYLIDEVLGCLDLIKLCTRGKYSQEKLYNFCLRKKWTWFINKLYQLGLFLTCLNEKIIKRIITAYLLKQKPDLVISVVPLFNNMIKDSCKECNIPFLLIPTDLDSTSFVGTITNPIYKDFILTIPFDDDDILKFSVNSSITNYNKKITGFPIKPAFFKIKDIDAIKKEFNVPADTFTILVLMGAAGSQATYYYLLTLLELSQRVHIIICLGRNEALRKNLEKITVPIHITLSIISYTNRISDLMSISNVCITKAGTVSVCEAIYMNLPIILDNTSTPLYWEKFNIGFIQKNKFGIVVTHYDQLNNAVTKMMHDSSYYHECVRNLTNFPKKEFGNYLNPLIEQLLNAQKI